MTTDVTRVRNAVGRHPKTTAEIVRITGLPIERVECALKKLQLKGTIKASPEGFCKARMR